MFEEAVDDGDDLDVFRVFGIAGFEAADAADVEADIDAGLGGFVEGLDDVGVLEGVGFGDDACGESLFGAFGLTVDEV